MRNTRLRAAINDRLTLAGLITDPGTGSPTASPTPGHSATVS